MVGSDQAKRLLNKELLVSWGVCFIIFFTVLPFEFSDGI